MSVPDIAVGLLGDPRLAEADLDDAEGTADGSSHPQARHALPATTTSLPAGNIEVGLTGDYRRWSSRYIGALMGADAIVGVIAVGLSTADPNAIRPGAVASWTALVMTGAVAWPVWLAFVKGYQRRSIGIGGTETMSVLKAAVAVIVLSALGSAWFGVDRVLSSAAVALPTAIIGSLAVRYAAAHRLRRTRRKGGLLRRLLVVGSPEAAHQLCAAISRETDMGMRAVAVCVPTDEIARARDMGLPVAGDIDHVAQIAHDLDCHAVAVTGAASSRQSFLRPLAWSLEGSRVELLIHPGLEEVSRPRMHVHSWTALPLLAVDLPRFDGWRRHVKRATDLVISGLGLLFALPLMFLIAVAVKLDDHRGPILFKQTRIGIDGKPFTMWKFRSMVVDAELRLAELRAQNEGAGPLFKIQNDPRITRVGRFLRKYSLDEIPQLFNVLAGSMSMVGPRPPLQTEVDAYAEHIRRRLKVMPGLTGLWQVSGRSSLSWEESVRLDLRYVENWSLGLDLQIIWRTVSAVLTKRGAA